MLRIANRKMILPVDCGRTFNLPRLPSTVYAVKFELKHEVF